jgi:hypothetical protein
MWTATATSMGFSRGAPATTHQVPRGSSSLRGDGKGAFADASGSVALSASPQSLTLADVNGDRRLDLVVTHGHTPSISVLLNNGDGAFALAPGSPLGDRRGVVRRGGGRRQRRRKARCARRNGCDRDGAARRWRRAICAGARVADFVPVPAPIASAPPTSTATGKLDVAAPSFEGNAVTVFVGTLAVPPATPSPGR